MSEQVCNNCGKEYLAHFVGPVTGRAYCGHEGIKQFEPAAPESEPRKEVDAWQKHPYYGDKQGYSCLAEGMGWHCGAGLSDPTHEGEPHFIDSSEPPAVPPAQEEWCGDPDPHGYYACRKPKGHKGYHSNFHMEWAAQRSPQPASAGPIKPKCPDCNAVGLSHCSDPLNCGGVYWPDHMYRAIEAQLATIQRSHAAEVEKLRADLSRGLNVEFQRTNCAICGVYKHTPVRNDDLGGYVCGGCLEKAYESAEAELEKWKQCCGELEKALIRYKPVVNLVATQGVIDFVAVSLARAAALREGKEVGNG